MRGAGVSPAMPVFVPAFFEERRQGRRRGNLKGRSTVVFRPWFFAPVWDGPPAGEIVVGQVANPMSLTLPKIGECGRTGGADPLVRAGRPRPALRAKNQALAWLREADEGVVRGPGGPPHHLCRRAPNTYVSDIGLPTCPTLTGGFSILVSAAAVAAQPGDVSPCMHPTYRERSHLMTNPLY